MAQRMVYNDFVAGEISPELWGRHDVDMYHHAAARIENFIPRRTGGLRKRAGTELLWHLAPETEGEEREYRVVPYFYDKDAFGLLALWRAAGSQKVHAVFLAHRADGTKVEIPANGTENGAQKEKIDVFEIGVGERLADLHAIQIGDTLFFTFHGHSAFKCAVTFDLPEPAVEWSQVQPTAKPADAPALSASAHNFQTGNAYKAGTRTYRLWGVKDGVLSKASEVTVGITLAWISGAYIDVKFTPDWGAHDYYILGKLQGGQYGEVTRYYPGLDTGERQDTSWALTTHQEELIGGTLYHAATINPQATWSDPNSSEDAETADGLHANGTFACRLEGTHTPADAKVLSVLLWTGAVMAANAVDGTPTRVGLAQQVTAKLWAGADTSGTPVETWTFTPQYGESARKLTVGHPEAAAGGAYTLTFEDAEGNEVYVPLRGCILCSDSGTRTFHDDNIQPGTLAGEQDALDVGDAGMDVDCIATWQQRLIAAGSNNLPFTLWFSSVGDLYNFYTSRPQNADDAFEATMAATRAMRIRHIVAEKWLLVFTDTGEYMVDATGGALAFNTIDIRKIAGVGSHAGIQPAATESEVLFVASDARSVYKMDYTLERDSVVPTNLSVRAGHIAEASAIRAIAYQRYPDSILWCLLEDGTLASLTFFPDENVCAWARHTLAGGDGLKAVDIFATDSIRSDDGTASTTDTFLVLTHPDHPGDVWVERMRPNVVVDNPSAAAAMCADHMGYITDNAEDAQGLADPQANVEACLETLRIEPQQADTIGTTTAQFGAILRILRSGEVAVRPVGGTEWRKAVDKPVERFQPGKPSRPVVKLVRTDARIAPQVVWNREGRFEIRSADEWPCDILSLCILGQFGTMRNGG